MPIPHPCAEVLHLVFKVVTKYAIKVLNYGNISFFIEDLVTCSMLKQAYPVIVSLDFVRFCVVIFVL